MNNKIETIIHENCIRPIAYQKIKNVYIIKSRDNDYVIKLNTNNYDIYKYLETRNFSFYPRNFNHLNDDYDLSLYIKGIMVNKEQKISDYVKLIALLHLKTSYKREISLDEMKEKYEGVINEINNLRKYYLNLNETINHELFLSPSHYLLVRNISLIYSLLDNVEILLNNVYQSIKDERSIRVVLLHNNVDLDHLIVSNQEYLISWDKAYFDIPIYEIASIYRKFFHDIELDDVINIYEKVNKLSLLEKQLLMISLSIPQELKLTNNTYLDTSVISNEIGYLNKVYKSLIKYTNKI